MKSSKVYEIELYKSLKDPDEAREYLNAALEDGDTNVFLLALKDVARARGGIQKLAQNAQLNRESLYRALSSHGNPRLNSLVSVLDTLGFKIAIENAPNISRHKHVSAKKEAGRKLQTAH